MAGLCLVPPLTDRPLLHHSLPLPSAPLPFLSQAFATPPELLSPQRSSEAHPILVPWRNSSSLALYRAPAPFSRRAGRVSKPPAYQPLPGSAASLPASQRASQLFTIIQIVVLLLITIVLIVITIQLIVLIHTNTNTSPTLTLGGRKRHPIWKTMQHASAGVAQTLRATKSCSLANTLYYKPLFQTRKEG